MALLEKRGFQGPLAILDCQAQWYAMVLLKQIDVIVEKTSKDFGGLGEEQCISSCQFWFLLNGWYSWVFPLPLFFSQCHQGQKGEPGEKGDKAELVCSTLQYQPIIYLSWLLKVIPFSVFPQVYGPAGPPGPAGPVGPMVRAMAVPYKAFISWFCHLQAYLFV